MIHTKINEIDLQFITDQRLFSPRSIDRGTLAMLEAVEFRTEEKVLDLGCGYGVVGIYVAKRIGMENVVMTDVDPLAAALSRKNAVLNGVEGVTVVCGDIYGGMDDHDFSLILVNPPYHTDFSVPKKMIEKGFNRLRVGGRMMMVTKRKEWYRNKLAAIFGGTRIAECNGYFVFEAEKRRSDYQKR